jgi:hypothetical protein
VEITLTYDDYEIYYYYDEMNESKYLSTIIEIGDNKYFCYKRCEKSAFSSEEDVKWVIEENNTIVLWETIIGIFEKLIEFTDLFDLMLTGKLVRGYSYGKVGGIMP